MDPPPSKRLKQELSSNGQLINSNDEKHIVKTANNGVLSHYVEKKEPFASTIKLSGHRGPVHTCKFSPDGYCLATAGYDRNILVWDVFGEDCANISTIKSHNHSIQQLDWLDKVSILSCSVDKSVSLSDINSESTISKWKDHTKIINTIVADKNSETLFLSGGDDCEAVLYDVRDKSCVARFDNSFEVFSVELRDMEVFVAGLDSVIKLFDKRKTAEVVYELKGHNDSITSISLEDAHLVSYDMRGNLILWDINRFIESERLLKRFNLVGKQQTNLRNFHEKNLLRARLCGARVGVGSVENYSAVVLDVVNGHVEHEMIAHDGAVFEVDFNSLNNDIFATCSADKGAFIICPEKIDVFD